MIEYSFKATDYILDVGPYFFGAIVIAFILSVISVWWSRGFLMKSVALVALGLMVWFVSSAVNKTNGQIIHVVNKANSQIDLLLSTLLSRPKRITFDELQDMLPEGHPGHLVLYGEAGIASNGIYLLLKSPGILEPRYYLMIADNKQQEQFKDAEHQAKQKKTQLFLGGKQKGRGKKSGGSGQGRDENQGRKAKDGASGHGTQRSEGGLGVFHPAPVGGDSAPKPD